MLHIHNTGLKDGAEGRVGALLGGLEAEDAGDDEEEAGGGASGEGGGAAPLEVAEDAAGEDEEAVGDGEAEIVHLLLLSVDQIKSNQARLRWELEGFEWGWECYIHTLILLLGWEEERFNFSNFKVFQIAFTFL